MASRAAQAAICDLVVKASRLRISWTCPSAVRSEMEEALGDLAVGEAVRDQGGDLILTTAENAPGPR